MFNRAFNVLTSQALELIISRVNVKDNALIVFDIDNMKSANTKLGKQEVNKRLTKAFSFRSADVILGQTFSGDEFAAFVNSSDAFGFATRLRDSLHKQSLSATIVILDYVGKETFEEGELMVQTMKANNQKDTILDARKTK